jgi:hypothetical protein
MFTRIPHNRRETMRSQWDEVSKQPTIEEILSDPIVQLVMARDHIGPACVREAIALGRRRLAAGPVDRAA